MGKGSRSCTYTLFLPQRTEAELIFALRAAISGIQAGFQNGQIWALSLAIGKSFRNCTHNLYLDEIEFNFALWRAVSKISADFENCYIWQ